jgi:hypothetical protein
LEKLALEGDRHRVVELLNELAVGELLTEDPLVLIEDDSQAAVSWS